MVWKIAKSAFYCLPISCFHGEIRKKSENSCYLNYDLDMLDKTINRTAPVDIIKHILAAESGYEGFIIHSLLWDRVSFSI